MSEPVLCSICGDMEYRCPVCDNEMPSENGRFVHHTFGGGQWICRGSGQPLPEASVGAADGDV